MAQSLFVCHLPQLSQVKALLRALHYQLGLNAFTLSIHNFPAPQVACKCTVLHFQTMHKEFIQQSWWLFCSSAFVVPLRWISPCSWEEQTQDLTLGRALWWMRLPFCPLHPHAVISLLAIWEIWQKVRVARCPTSSASPATRAQTWCSISTQNQLIDKHTAQQNIFHTAEAVQGAAWSTHHGDSKSNSRQDEIGAANRFEGQACRRHWHSSAWKQSLYLPSLFIFYYSTSGVHRGNDDLIKGPLNSMKTLQFIGLP